MKKIFVLILLLLVFCSVGECVTAAELSDYDFDDVGRGIEDENFELDFAGLIESVYNNDLKDGGLFEKLVNIFFKEIRNSMKLVSLALGVIVAGAVFKNITEILNDMSVIKTGAFITYLAVMMVLFVTFQQAHSLTTETAGKIMDFLYSLVPTFFCAVTFTSGSISGSLLYQWTGMCLGIVNVAVVNFLLPLTNYYVVISVINNCTEDKKFSSMCGLIKKLIMYANRAMLGLVVGMTSIKSMTVPLSGSLKNTFLKKTISFIPGIGSGVESIAEVIAGSGNLIKNTIGAAGLIFVVILMITPIIKLVVMNFLLHFLGAVTEPVSNKNITLGITAITDGIGLLQYILCTSSLVMMLTIGIICITTGG